MSDVIEFRRKIELSIHPGQCKNRNRALDARRLMTMQSAPSLGFSGAM